MKTIMLLFSLITGTGLMAQIQNPVRWEFSAKKKSADTFDLTLKATLDGGWHIYSQTQPAEAIAVPTEVVYNKNPMVTITGIPKEVGKKEKYQDPSAGIVQYQYAGELELVQRATVKTKEKTTVSGTVTYQVCTNQMCLPPKKIPFAITLN